METHTLEVIDIIVIALYFIICLAVGLVATLRTKRGTSQGYFLAGQSSNWFIIGASTFATNVGAPMYIGLAGAAAVTGIAVTSFEWFAMLCLLALGWLFLPVYRASGCYTMPEYLRKRFGGRRISLLLAFLNVIKHILDGCAGQMYAGALFIQLIFDWNIYLCAVVILSITALYTVLGGLKAVMWTDTLQTAILIIGSVTLSIISLTKLDDIWTIKEQFLSSASNSTLTENLMYGNASCGLAPPDSFHIYRPATDGAYPWPGMTLGVAVVGTYVWCTDQTCVQRSLSTKNVSHAKGGMLFAAWLKVLSAFFFVVPGIISRILFPDEVACADPETCREICDNPSGCANIAYPLLVMRILPQGMKGLMVAGMLAAMMSSLTSVFNSSSTVFTLEIWKFFRPLARETEVMVVGRLYTVVLAIVAFGWLPILLAIQGTSFWDYIQSIASHLFPPILAAFITGMFWKRTTEKAAFWGLVCGSLLGITRLVLTWVHAAPHCGAGADDNRWAIIKHVHYLHFAVILFLVTVVIVIIISLLTKPLPSNKLCRVTYWTRFDKYAEDEDTTKDNDGADEENNTRPGHGESIPLNAEAGSSTDTDDSSDIPSPRAGGKCVPFLKSYICGIDTAGGHGSAGPQRELRRNREATDISENPRTSHYLDILCVITACTCVFLHVYFF